MSFGDQTDKLYSHDAADAPVSRPTPAWSDDDVSLSIRVANLNAQYIAETNEVARDLMIGRRESDELDAYIEKYYSGVMRTCMAKNDEAHFMGLRLIRTSALSLLAVGRFTVEK